MLIDENNNIIVKNANNTIVNGFPINGSFYGVPLIANILNIEDGYPEIIYFDLEEMIADEEIGYTISSFEKCIDESLISDNACDDYYDPVCGCDSNTYSNECFAGVNGIISWINGVCD